MYITYIVKGGDIIYIMYVVMYVARIVCKYLMCKVLNHE